MGCQFALDDFGSGVGSFSNLKNLPLDYLKIDGSFFKNLARDTVNQAMVTAMIKLARTLNFKVIAEQVEDASALDAARRMGVDYLQGYAIGRPEPLAWRPDARPAAAGRQRGLSQRRRKQLVGAHERLHERCHQLHLRRDARCSAVELALRAAAALSGSDCQAQRSRRRPAAASDSSGLQPAAVCGQSRRMHDPIAQRAEFAAADASSAAHQLAAGAVIGMQVLRAPPPAPASGGIASNHAASDRAPDWRRYRLAPGLTAPA